MYQVRDRLNQTSGFLEYFIFANDIDALGAVLVMIVW
jgi:hypothetical protein